MIELPDDFMYIDREDDLFAEDEASMKLFRVFPDRMEPASPLTPASMAFNGSVISKAEAEKMLRKMAAS